MRILCIILSMYTLFIMGEDQEFFNTTPPPVLSNFSCLGRQIGYYADVDTNCRAYHTCDDHSNHFIHYCPEDTAFRQDAMICDHAYRVDCRRIIENARKYTNLWKDGNPDALFFAEPRSEGTNLKEHAKHFYIYPLVKNITFTKYSTSTLHSRISLLDRETDEKWMNPLFRLHGSNDKSTRIRINAKNHTKDLLASIQSYAMHSKNLISTTAQTMISVDQEASTELLRTSKAFSSFHHNKLSFLVPIFKNFSKYSENNDASFQKNISDTQVKKNNDRNNLHKNSSENFILGSQMKNVLLDIFKVQGFSTESNLKLFFKKPVNFLEPPNLKSNFSISSRSNFNFYNNYPYIATLNSIQNNRTNINSSIFDNPFIKSRSMSSYEIIKKTTVPLINDMDRDPYYPKSSTTTEVYYTSTHQMNKLKKPYSITTKKPIINVEKFEIPLILPDLNCLEDLLDRKKYFFIPRLKSP